MVSAVSEVHITCLLSQFENNIFCFDQNYLNILTRFSYTLKQSALLNIPSDIGQCSQLSQRLGFQAEPTIVD
jgi:hypothetical protein